MERINATTGSYNFIDLFAGAGGLSEGFIQAGFSPVAHVEMNPYAAQTLETRTGYYYLKAQGKLDIYKDYIRGKITRDEFLQHIPEEQLQSVFCETMSNETLPRLFENIDRILTQRGIKQVDVIIGGPPCQAYSLAGVSLLAFEVYAFYIKSVARSFYSQLLLLWIPMRTKFPLCFLSAFFLMLFLIPFI